MYCSVQVSQSNRAARRLSASAFGAARNVAYTREERNRYESGMMNEKGFLFCGRATKNLCAVFLGKSLSDSYLHIANAHK